MVPKHCMLIAGEPSGDLLAAELVSELRAQLTDLEGGPSADQQPLTTGLAPRFFGAGGPRMAAAGVELAVDLSAHAVTGFSDVLKHYLKFRRIFWQLYALAMERQPHAIICVDFSGFNLRFARAISRQVRRSRGSFCNWEPSIVQYVSPQVWASRPGRAAWLERHVDLLLCTLPFEKDWYARHAAGLPVRFVGNPLLDRHADYPPVGQGGAADTIFHNPVSPLVLLLPGSRAGELRHHLAVMAQAAREIAARKSVRCRMVLPNEKLAETARSLLPADSNIELRVGGLPESLTEADLAIASTGTVTLECAYYGVPTVALYRTSWSTYQIARRLAHVEHLAMPNLLAGRAVIPEFIQDAATPANLAQAGLELLNDPARRKDIKQALAGIIKSLGAPGAARRAAREVTALFREAARGFPLRAHLAA